MHQWWEYTIWTSSYESIVDQKPRCYALKSISMCAPSPDFLQSPPNQWLSWQYDIKIQTHFWKTQDSSDSHLWLKDSTSLRNLLRLLLTIKLLPAFPPCLFHWGQTYTAISWFSLIIPTPRSKPIFFSWFFFLIKFLHT